MAQSKRSDYADELFKYPARDHYESLDELCMVYDLDKAEISSKLDVIGYHYDPEKNGLFN